MPRTGPRSRSLLVRIQGVAEVLGRSGGGKRHPLAVESLHALGVRLEVEPAVDVVLQVVVRVVRVRRGFLRSPSVDGINENLQRRGIRSTVSSLLGPGRAEFECAHREPLILSTFSTMSPVMSTSSSSVWFQAGGEEEGLSVSFGQLWC